MDTGKSLYQTIIHLKRTSRDGLVQCKFNSSVLSFEFAPGAAEPVFLDWNSGMPFTKPYFLSNLKSQEILATTKLIFSPIVQESIDESVIKEAILTRLDDDRVDVVLSAVSAFEVSNFVVHEVHVLLVNIYLSFFIT